jgi:hypothetical protein
MYEIKNINKNSLAKIFGLFYGLVGFFMAIGVAAFTVINITFKEDFEGSAIMVALFNFGAGLLLGVMVALAVAAIGWLLGYIVGGLYNWFAKKVGGIKIELARTEVAPQSGEQDKN